MIFAGRDLKWWTLFGGSLAKPTTMHKREREPQPLLIYYFFIISGEGEEEVACLHAVHTKLIKIKRASERQGVVAGGYFFPLPFATIFRQSREGHCIALFFTRSTLLNSLFVIIFRRIPRLTRSPAVFR